MRLQIPEFFERKQNRERALRATGRGVGGWPRWGCFKIPLIPLHSMECVRVWGGGGLQILVIAEGPGQGGAAEWITEEYSLESQSV